MNILVTGANGFIGSNICSFLEKNKKYTIFKGTRDTINLYSFKDVSTFINTHKINTIIHCAIEGGKRNIKDTESVVYNNILMAQNLITCKIDGLFINIASGAEFDRINDIFIVSENEIYTRTPSDYYGLSKNIVSKLVNQLDNGTNIRIFGCFNYNETTNRMIRANINNYINKQPMIIHQDRYMDFIYIKDLYNIIDFILQNYIKIDINAVYTQKYKLSDIAALINNLDIYKVPIILETNQVGNNYCGNGLLLSKLNITHTGVEAGLVEYYKNII